jgi:hypothetical protein
MSYQGDEIKRLADFQKHILSNPRGRAVSEKDAILDARAECQSRLQARENYRRAVERQRSRALQDARLASAHANSTAVRCFVSSFLCLAVACGLNTLNPCPIFIDATLGLLVFVIAAWAVIVVDHATRIAALAR